MIPAHRDAAFRMVLIVPLAIALVPAPVPGQTILTMATRSSIRTRCPGHSRCPDHADGGEFSTHGGNATQLDINGNPRTKLKTTVQGQAVRLHLPKDALYVVLEAK